MTTPARQGTILSRLLWLTLPLVLLTALVWVMSSVYFQGRVDSIYEARRLAQMIKIEALETRREQDEFLLEDVRDPAFRRTGDSPNIRDQDLHYRSAFDALRQLSDSGSIIPRSESLELGRLLGDSHRRFFELVDRFKELSHRDRSSIQALAEAEDVTSQLIKDFVNAGDRIDPLLSRFVAELSVQAQAERARAYWLDLLIGVLSVLIEFVFVWRTTRMISGPLVDLKEKVALFRENGGELVSTPCRIEEIRLLDDAFCRMTRDLSRTQRQLLQAQKLESIGTLAGGIAHDFNNLLAGILAYSGILKRRLAHDQTATNELSIIERSAERGAELTKQILGFARKGGCEKVSFDVNQTILECRNLLYRTMDKTITVKADLGAKLHAVEGDPGQVLQALMNLGVNARDAMPEGGDLLFESQNIEADEHFCKVHGGLKPGHYVRISVADTGTGIPKQVQEKIFDPFFTTKEVGKGTGLGLSLVYGIMQTHKGLVSLYSEVGHGSRFHLYFPAAIPVSPARPADLPSATTSSASRGLEGRVILVVDDEALMRDVARGILEAEGATLFFATNGQEALEFLEGNHSMIHLVMMDVIMPKMDGIKTLHEIRKLGIQLPLLFSSGYAESQAIAELRRAANVGFIQKPYKAEALVERILDHLARADAESADSVA